MRHTSHIKHQTSYIIVILAALFFNPLHSYGSEQHLLSPSAYASILTCGPGDEIYETFGHSALRICDTAAGIDIVFNYGIFDFSESYFYLKFAKGTLNYRLAIQDYDNFMYEYWYYHRAVWEQRLLLTHDELERLYALLCENYKPENRYYKYDFFRDNCATRVDDIIYASIAKENQLAPQSVDRPMTYRDMLYKYCEGVMPWWQLGVEILLGARCDKVMDARQYRFIPMEMMTQYDTATTVSNTRLAGEREQMLVDSRDPQSKTISPTLFFWLLLLVVAALSLWAQRKGRKLYWLDFIIFLTVSCISILLIYLWFVSDHWCTKWNFNLLWANPILLVLLFRLRKQSRKLTLIAIGMLLMLVIIWPFGIQHFNAAILPISLTILVRLSVRLMGQRKTEDNNAIKD